MAVLVTVFLFANVLLLSVRSYPTLSWYLPVAVEYYSVPGLWLINVASMTFAFAAIVTLGYVIRHPARWVLLLACIGIVAMVEYRFRTSPLILPPEVRQERIGEDGVVRQTSGATCAAATCANVARMLGIHATEGELVALLGTTEAGTTPAQIVYAMHGLGFACTKRYVRDRDITKVKAPAVLFVMAVTEVDGHVVALAKVAVGQAEIWDPSAGKMLISVQELPKRWGGRAIEIGRR